MEQLAALFTERPYVVAFLAAFLLIAWAERGWQRMLFWLVSGTFIGWLVEFSSTRTSFPFGAYTYHEELFPDELWIGGVPFFASISIAFLAYFGYSAACTLLSRLERRGLDVQRRVDPRLDGSLRVLVLAAVIATWMDTVIDPVTHLGEFWFLGDLYAYHEDGIHFGVPVTNYAGWLFTTATIVFINQRFDAWLRSRNIAAGGFYLPLKPMWAVGTVLGNFAFMLGVTVYLLAPDRVPDTVALPEVLVSGVVLSGLFVLFATFMLYRGLAAPAATPAVAGSMPDGGC